jgi:cell wall-associated NlpC family hydrolase
MTLEGFVRAAGAAMGMARDSFGPDVTGVAVPAPNTFSPPDGLFAGSGQAAQASDTVSGQLATHAAALSERNSTTHGLIAGTLDAVSSGRNQMNGHIDAATADVQRLAPSTTSPQGQVALVSALTKHLRGTQQTLQDHAATAGTHAAATQTEAAAYHGVAQPFGAPSGGSPASGMSTGMGAMPLAGLGGFPGLMGSQPGGQSGQRKDSSTAAGTDGGLISAVVQRALSQHGTPYVWGGGGPHGPTHGGFDCSSLMQYAFAGAGVDLPRTTYDQIGLGRSVSPGAIRAGDLIFSNFGEGGVAGPGHVQLAISSTHVVEAPHTGATVQVSPIPSGHLAVRRILS